MVQTKTYGAKIKVKNKKLNNNNNNKKTTTSAYLSFLYTRGDQTMKVKHFVLLSAQD